MNRIRKFLPHMMAALVGATMLGAPAQARAGFNVQVYDDGALAASSFLNTIPGLMWSFGATTTNFSVGGSANIQLLGNGQLSVSYNDVVTTLTSGTHTLTLLVTNTEYMLPTGTPVRLTSAGGGSYIGGIGNTVVGNTLGFLDPGNAEFGQVTVNGNGSVSPNAQSTPASTTGTINGTGGSVSMVYTPGTGSALVTSTVPFSLTNVSYFTFTGAAGDFANISNSVATTATPAPAGLVLAFSGLPVLGIGRWLKGRRRQVV